MPEEFRGYRIVNILSLDVVAGSMVSSAFFSKIFLVPVYGFELIALGLTVWLIYTFDHLRDAGRILHAASTERHRFHQVHSKALKRSVFIIAAIDAGVITQLHRQLFVWGVLLGALTVVLLLIQRHIPWIKEFLISIFYTAGVLLPVIPFATETMTAPDYILIIQFALTALINLLVFSWYSYKEDKRDNFNSLVTAAGVKLTRFALYTCWFMTVLLSLYQSTSVRFFESIIILSIATVLMTIFIFSSFFSLNNRYRYLGDVLFLIPLIYYF